MNTTKTASFSLDESTIKGIDSLSRQRKFSKSDAVREIYRVYEETVLLASLQAKASSIAHKHKLKITSEDDIEAIFG